MGIQNTDLFLVERGGLHYKMEAGRLPDFLDSPVIVSATNPLNPVEGQIWYNTSLSQLNIWVEVDGVGYWANTSTVQNLEFFPVQSTVGSSVDVRLQSHTTVQDFGAVGDGVVDDTIAIQNALQSVTPWGVLKFPNGTYKVTTSLVIPVNSSGNSGVTIEGSGFGSRIVATTDEPIFVGEASFITFKNLVLDGGFSAPGPNSCGIRMSGSRANIGSSPFSGLTVMGSYFRNFTTAIETSVSNCRITGNSAKNVYQFLHSVDGFKNSIVSENVVDDGLWTGDAGPKLPHLIHLGVADNSKSLPTDVKIFANKLINGIDNPNTRCLNIIGGSDISIYNNILECQFNSSPSNVSTGVISCIATLDSIKNVSIKNNTINIGRNNNLECGVYISDNSSEDTIEIRNITIDGNSFSTVDNFGYAIWIESIFDFIISNNSTDSGIPGGAGFDGGPTNILRSKNGKWYNNRDIFDTGDPLSCPFRTNNFSSEVDFTNSIRAMIGSEDTTLFYGGSYHELLSNSPNAPVAVFADYSDGASYTGCILHTRSLYQSGDTIWKHWKTGNDDLIIYGNGDFANRNNFYGGLSDEILKSNITPIESQWTIVKSIQFHKYVLKQDPTNAVKLGVIAQEVEQVAPELVISIPERDISTGELTGEYSKAVNYSELFSKAFGALQEAIARVEKLQVSIRDLEKASK